MSRFPNYKQYLEYEKKIMKIDNDQIQENLFISWMVRILRVVPSWLLLQDLEDVVLGETKFREWYSENILKYFDEGKYCEHFTYKYLNWHDRSKDECSVKLLKPSSFKDSVKNMGFDHFNEFGDLEDIIKMHRLPMSRYYTADYIKREVQRLINKSFPNFASVRFFGSIPIKLSTRGSDVDLLIKFKKMPKQAKLVNFFEQLKAILMNNDFDLLSTWNKNELTPVMKFWHKETEFSVDISVYSPILVLKSNLINAYCNLNSEIKKAVLLIKIWAERRDINNPAKNHTVSSFCHVIMFITYLIMIGAVPNLRKVPPSAKEWTQDINYKPRLDPQVDPVSDDILQEFRSTVPNQEGDGVPIYFKRRLKVQLCPKWDLKRALKSYFFYMGFEFSYRDLMISLYHGNVVGFTTSMQPFAPIREVTDNSKLLRVLDPFELDQLESKAAKPWCVDGLKWEFMRGFHLLQKGKVNALFATTTPPTIQDVFKYNMFTHINYYEYY